MIESARACDASEVPGVALTFGRAAPALSFAALAAGLLCGAAPIPTPAMEWPIGTLQSGGWTHTVPLELPPAPAGMVPQLTFVADHHVQSISIWEGSEAEIRAAGAEHGKIAGTADIHTHFPGTGFIDEPLALPSTRSEGEDAVAEGGDVGTWMSQAGDYPMAHLVTANSPFWLRPKYTVSVLPQSAKVSIDRVNPAVTISNEAQLSSYLGGLVEGSSVYTGRVTSTTLVRAVAP